MARLVGHGALAGRVGRTAQPVVLMPARVRGMRNEDAAVVVEVGG
ncbi:hypothetical protein GJR88_00309 [Dietzia sp. DQ12-45-1b]|nr:hypothetical protein GJR88_00309 [Dietzia sp. DQ12-45-1b]